MRTITLRRPVLHLIAVLVMTGLLTSGIGVYGYETVSADTGKADAGSIAVGDHIYMGAGDAAHYTGLPYWRVIDKDNSDGSLFLMSEYLWTGSDPEDFIKFNVIPSEGVPLEGYEDFGYMSRGSAWQGSLAQAWCQGFEAEVLSGVKGLELMETTKSDEEFQSPDDPDVAFARTQNILNKDKVFFLSGEEAVHYMPAKSERFAYLHDGKQVGDPCDYWLRSPRLFTFSECVGKVLAYGDKRGAVARQTASSLSAARPAFRAKFSGDVRIARCAHDGKVTWTIDPASGNAGCSGIRYVWSSDKSRCTASATCNICGKKISETAKTSSKVTKQAGILENGIRTFTASFSNEFFTTQTKQAVIPKTYDPAAGVPKGSLPKLTIKTPAVKKKVLTVRWKKLSKSRRKKVSGIEIQTAADSKFSNKAVIRTAGKNSSSLRISKLKKGRKYWIRIRTFRKKNGIKYVGKWSGSKKIKIK